MYEKKTEALLPTRQYYTRVARILAIIIFLIALSLPIGTIGYRMTEGLSWIDAEYNAALILSGMGPATELHTEAGKIFASAYSLYSGLLLIALTGLLLAPVFHRLIHSFHIESDKD